MKISIFGLGYVGCVTAGCLVKQGHEIIGVDLLSSKVDQLNSGKPTVGEAGLPELIAEGFARGLVSATRNGPAAVQASDASIICVGTPSGPDGSLDLTALRATVELVGSALREKHTRHVVILRSTVPAGTAENLVLPLVCPGPAGEHFAQSNLLVVPEFLREGSAIADYYDPPFTVIGSATGQPDANQPVMVALFGDLGGRLDWVLFREAEMLKAVCNGFHALKVAFANEVGALCAGLGIDGHALMTQFVRDAKLNVSPAYLRPGLPFGGSCLPKDLRMLSQTGNRLGIDLPLLRGALASNEAHLQRTLEAVPKSGRPRIGLDGLSFKAGTDDLRESPIVRIAEHLLGKGYDLRIYDPAIKLSMLTGTNREYIEEHIPHLSSRLVQSPDELIEHSELLLVARDCEPLLERMAVLGKIPQIIDLRGENHIDQKLNAAIRRLKEKATPPNERLRIELEIAAVAP